MAKVNELVKVLTHKELSILEAALSKYISESLLTGVSKPPCDILHGQIKAAKEATKTQLLRKM